MWRRLASVLLFLVIASLVIACEAISHANDYSTATEGINNCATGTLPCNGSCVPEDAKNCGSCGVTCEATQVCSNGTCGSSCTGGTTQCPGPNGGADVCVDTQTDPANCGRCGGFPDAGACPLCQNGQCTSSCEAPSTLCGNKCVDILTDPDNCNGCGLGCKNGEFCSAGSCSSQCSGSLKACGSLCVDESTDTDHCGNCTTHCVAPISGHGVPVCASLLGQTGCGVACEQGFTNCANQCLCGSNCPNVTGMGGGNIAVVCAVGFTCTNGTCVSKH